MPKDTLKFYKKERSKLEKQAIQKMKQQLTCTQARTILTTQPIQINNDIHKALSHILHCSSCQKWSNQNAESLNDIIKHLEQAGYLAK